MAVTEIFSKVSNILSYKERKSLFFLFGLMLVGMVLEILGIGLVLPVIHILTQTESSTLHPLLQDFLKKIDSYNLNTIVVVMLFLGGIYIVKNIFLAFSLWLQIRFSFQIQVNISQRLFTLYLHQPYTFHLQRNSAELIRNITSEVGMFAVSLITPCMLFVAEVFVLFGICALLLYVEFQGTLIVMFLLAIAGGGFYFYSKNYISRWGIARQYHDGMRIQHLQQGIGGAKDVKLLGRESEFLNQFNIHTVQSAKVNQFQATLQQLPRLWFELLAVLGLVTLVLIMLEQGKDVEVIMPTLGLFAAAAFRLMPSVNRLLGAAQSIRFSLPVINTLNTEFQLIKQDLNNCNSSNASEFKNEIKIIDVSYTYENSIKPALSQFSLTIKKGKSIGFIGTSGSGKSTLVDLILGLLPPDKGKITVDGMNIAFNLRAWQDHIGYVPQSIYLTDDTLRHNIAFGIPDDQIDDHAVERAIQAAQLNKYVAELSDGVNTVVGEQGTRLSGGQRQRIGIARALYHDPILLVMDEATSALDTATENSVMQTITELKRSKTILIVAHRLSTLKQCDWIYQLEDGKLIADGPPTKMLS